MSSSTGNTKVYIEIVRQLRAMIEADGLIPGDKIPSERELSERLNVGRSSVREALRALELLGLIETRRGEGTFIRDFRGNQLVELLSTFILQDIKAKNDVIETKHLIEMDCLRLIIEHGKTNELEKLQEAINVSVPDDDVFFYNIVKLSGNLLLLRIWTILKDYFYALQLEKVEHSKNDYLSLVHALKEKDLTNVIRIYRSLKNTLT